MVPPYSSLPQTWQLEESASNVAKVASTSVFSGFSSDDVGIQDHSSAFLTSNLSFDPNTTDAGFSPLDRTPGCIPQISPGLEYELGLMLDGNPVMNNSPQTSDGVPLSSVASPFDPPPISYTTDPNSQTATMGQDVEECFQTTAGPYAFTPVGIPPPGWGIGQQDVGFSFENPPVFNFADPPVGIDGSSYPGENTQVVDLEAVQSPFYTAIPPFEQQLIPPEELVVHCAWRDEDGTVCGDVFVRAALPGHLSKHGIKNKSRNHATKCNWVGCKRKKTINRESIVRHIREVHLRIRRPSKGVQEPYPKGLVRTPNTG